MNTQLWLTPGQFLAYLKAEFTLEQRQQMDAKALYSGAGFGPLDTAAYDLFVNELTK